MVEAHHNLRQANEANSSYGEKLVWSEVDREFAEARAAELEKKNQETMTKNRKLKETLERYASRVSLLEAENQDLQALKASIKAVLDKNIDETLVMLGQSFDQVVR